MQRQPVTEETYLRDLPYSALAVLAETLDINGLWERLASRIPTKPDQLFTATEANFDPRYTMTNIASFGNSKKSCTMTLIRDWSKERKKCSFVTFLSYLFQALYQAELIAAAAYVQQKVLHTEPRSRQTENGRGPVISSETHPLITDPERETVMAVRCSLPCPPSGDNNCNRYSPFVCFCLISNFLCIKWNSSNEQYHFYKKINTDGGNLIGEGGFGTVFIGTFSDGYEVAIKCLKDGTDDSLEQFKTELQTLTMFKHENLVQLLGYSVDDGEPRCLVYEYMSNGSLEERLACRYNTEPLSNNLRLEIIKGTADGIAFLHKGGLVHRDIKSANILLDSDFKPKVGDFATARVLPQGMASHIMKTSVVIGTAAYLAPEAISFHIHPSLDSYSFGVVILEILTGLPVTDPNRAEKDLKFHVQEYCSEGDDGEEPGSFYDLLDPKGGEWSKSIVDGLYSISCRCLEYVRKKRPVMADIVTELTRLEQIINDAETEV
ncbi:unnamed protein product [Candidula unifasciata]|uniref:non-specific serine/threonine protein kinase n=1 Tax=Candidula unifasciata TaxID=100452 RepID=A0A8S4A6U8_9EUPU|nr:unnamed protein product [Candidula unifasciata]